ncbi:hypothetical protein CAP35_14300 [Chitinophagaceae bacterium IBVUCB1]|nr:hypothetical protein CAP35_14300 [Chitinophagaceae bacterium IBVUCB1]
MIPYKRSISGILVAAFVIITLSAYHGGPAHGGLGNQTGSPNAGNCGNCHNGGSDTTISNISIRAKGQSIGDTATYYTSAQTYIITIRGRHSSYTTFGYQMLLLDSNNKPKGVFTSFGNYGYGFPQNNPHIAESYTRIMADTTGWFEDNIEWLSPVSSSGRLTLYAIVNAVDNNGQPSNDKAGTPMSIALQDSIPQGTGIQKKNINQIIRINPNPADDIIHISVPENDNIRIQLYNLHGNTLYAEASNPSSGIININTSAIPNGLYLLSLQSASISSTKLITIQH